ncbi:MAG: EamA family transporter [Acidobacteria bacterium]|nr:EamA family transporter [Acidobacteriota bacterium]
MRSHPLFGAYAALAAVCFFWGTTYLAIRVALETFPPSFLVAVRFLISSVILLIWAKWRGEKFPQGAVLWRTALNGVLILGVANGCLTYAEQLIPSGLAALFVTTSPFWLTGAEALVPGGEKLHAPTLAGMAVGLSGVALLVGPDSFGDHANMNSLWGFALLQVGNAGWSFGSILQKRIPRGINPVVSGAFQQLAAGLVWAVVALALHAVPEHPSARSIGAMLYLAMFGSIVAYSAYLIALDRLPVAIVSVYTYINPIVAVTLGWLVYREPFGPREAAAMVVIFLGVWLVKRFSR